MSPTPRARYGAAAIAHLKGQLPNPFPRTMGPNAMTYLQEVVDSGLASGLVERFEAAFAEALSVRHCVATPGCTPALAILAAAFPFEPGDEIIVSPITDYGTIQGLFRQGYIPVFADTAPGTKAPVVVIRKGKDVALTVTVGTATEAAAVAAAEEENGVSSLGVTVIDLTKELERKLDYKGEKGVIVSEVDENSAAYRHGIREGDLIVEVNRQPVTTPGEFQKAVNGAHNSVLLLVKNKEGSRFVVLRKK